MARGLHRLLGITEGVVNVVGSVLPLHQLQSSPLLRASLLRRPAGPDLCQVQLQQCVEDHVRQVVVDLQWELHYEAVVAMRLL